MEDEIEEIVIKIYYIIEKNLQKKETIIKETIIKELNKINLKEDNINLLKKRYIEKLNGLRKLDDNYNYRYSLIIVLAYLFKKNNLGFTKKILNDDATNEMLLKELNVEEVKSGSYNYFLMLYLFLILKYLLILVFKLILMKNSL